MWPQTQNSWYTKNKNKAQQNTLDTQTQRKRTREEQTRTTKNNQKTNFKNGSKYPIIRNYFKYKWPKCAKQTKTRVAEWIKKSQTHLYETTQDSPQN